MNSIGFWPLPRKIKVIMKSGALLCISGSLLAENDRIMSNPIGLGRMQKGVYVFQSVPSSSVATITGDDSYER